MPDLDVSFMVSDPMFADTFDVVRRQEAVSNKGRSVPTASDIFKDVVGTITQEEPDALDRRPEGQMVPRRIFVASEFRIQGAVAGYQPDLIRWNGTDYVVKEVLPFSRFGQGTYEVKAESMTLPDTAQ